jgi:hypothetical protein
MNLAGSASNVGVTCGRRLWVPSTVAADSLGVS